MKNRIVFLRDWNSEDSSIYVETNASIEEIEEAIEKKNDIRLNDLNDGYSDFEIIQNILNENGYDFSETAIEEVNW